MQDKDVRALVEPCTKLVGGLMHACHRLMAEFGHISSENREILANIFNLSHAEIRGFISFYHDFKTEPQPHRSIKICRAEACQAKNVRKMIDDIESHLRSSIPCNSKDDSTRIEFVYCLGLCPLGPAALFDGQVRAPVNSKQVIEQLTTRS